MVDEELVEVRQGTDPSDAEESGRWARLDPRDKPPEFSLPGELHSASLRKPLERPGKDHARANDEIAFTQHEMGGEVLGGPALYQRGYVSTEFSEEIAQRKALLGIKLKVFHISMVPTRFGLRSRIPH
ncbi:hypothetical protein MHAE_19296 [Mycobacterium haemophilum DSM 44634]